MTGRALPPGSYAYEQVAAGDWIDTGTTTITAEQIDTFADLTGDRFEIHMDDAAAQAKGFPARVAHGLLVLSLIDGLKNQAPAQFDAVASLGWDWQFSQPVFIGDTLTARIEIASKRTTKDPARGILTLNFTVKNQRNEAVQQGTNLLMVHR